MQSYTLALALLASLLAACYRTDAELQTDDAQTSFERAEFLAEKKSAALNRGRGKWRTANAREDSRWANNTIPYQYAPFLFTPNEVTGFREAMQVFMDETCLLFRPAEESDSYSIVVRGYGSGCSSSYVGRNVNYPGARAQSVNLGEGCRYYGMFLHELGHAIGLHHEHQSPDRDRHIEIVLDNVWNSSREWFQQLNQKDVNYFGVPHDLQSIMHYEQHAFSANGRKDKITIRALNPAHQRFLYDVVMKDLSFGDVKRLNLMYKCNKHCPKNIPCPEESGFINKHCQCETKQSYAERRCVNRQSDAHCEENRRYCDYQDKNMIDVVISCRKTCDRCYVPL